MANSNKKNNKLSKKNKSKNQALMRKPPGPARMVAPSAAARSWLEVLHNPCGAPLAYPCYGGIDTGYLVRVTNYFKPTYALTGATPGTSAPVDFMFQWTPSNISTLTGIVRSAQPAGALDTNLPGPFLQGFANLITNTTVVNRFRCVAACTKAIPTGSNNLRAGMLASAYSPGVLVQAGEVCTMSSVRAFCPNSQTVSNHTMETKWLPTHADERFTATSELNGGCGTLVVCGIAVDGLIQTSVLAAANLEIECTAVYEWMPDLSGSTAASTAPKLPSSTSSQQVLSTIRNLGQFLYDVSETFAGSSRVSPGRLAY